MEQSLAELQLGLVDAATVAGCSPAQFLREFAPKLKALTVDGPEGEEEPCWLYGDLMNLLGETSK